MGFKPISAGILQNNELFPARQLNKERDLSHLYEHSLSTNQNPVDHPELFDFTNGIEFDKKKLLLKKFALIGMASPIVCGRKDQR